MTQQTSSVVQFIKFCIVGVANTLVDWFVFYLLISTMLDTQHSMAKAISFIVAVLNSYLWNSIWTFKREYEGLQKQKTAVFLKFIVVSLVGWGINVWIFDLSLSSLSFEIFNKDLLPLVLASCGAILWNFFANKLWTYKK